MNICKYSVIQPQAHGRFCALCVTSIHISFRQFLDECFYCSLYSSCIYCSASPCRILHCIVWTEIKKLDKKHDIFINSYDYILQPFKSLDIRERAC